MDWTFEKRQDIVGKLSRYYRRKVNKFPSGRGAGLSVLPCFRVALQLAKPSLFASLFV